MTPYQLPLGESLGIVAPYYNLVLVLIVLVMFLKLFSIKNKKVFLLPWKLLFFAVSVYILEEMLTVFKIAGIVDIPRFINAVFEFVIITIFLYMLLIQKEHLRKASGIKKNAKRFLRKMPKN